MLVDKVFKEGLDSYNSKISVPFKFYLSNLLRKEINYSQKLYFFSRRTKNYKFIFN